jgi:hypothetical protein
LKRRDDPTYLSSGKETWGIRDNREPSMLVGFYVSLCSARQA